MAGDWIKMRTNLDTDPRVIHIASKLGLAELHVVGMLWKVWSWADQHSLDGNAVSVTENTLDRFTGAAGFAAELRKVDWLEGRDGALTFPRFAEHNGHTAKSRAVTKKRVLKHRGEKCNADVTLAPLPEKRREEIEEGERETARGSFRPPTESQAIAFASQVGIREEVASHWWEKREAAGWMRGTNGGGSVRIGSWHSDLKTSVSWVEKELAEQKQHTKSPATRTKKSWE